MSRFHGAQGKGALARHRSEKAQAAAERAQAAAQRAEHHLMAQNLTALADAARAAAVSIGPVVTAAGVFVDGKKVQP